MDSYPDELTYKLVGAASEVLGISADDALTAFGEFWVLYTGNAGYGDIMEMAGGNLRDFLFNLDNLHTRVGQSFTKLRPPSFRFDVIDDDVLRMHYLTERAGLCPMVIGLLNGLAKRFKSELAIEHDRCKRNGAEHCEFLLTLGGQAA
jgi:predicted hydrocarbon binding protein